MSGAEAHTVLVVDDDEALRGSMRVMLETHGYAVIEAGDSEEALRVMDAARPDLVVTDIYMPGADGYELINALRSRREDVPIIAMSGGAQFAELNQLKTAERLGAVAVIDKPFRVHDLVEMVGRVISASASRG
jgi:CheY-like chemotaxis protein